MNNTTNDYMHDVLVKAAQVFGEVECTCSEYYETVCQMARKDRYSPAQIRADLLEWAAELRNYADDLQEQVDLIEDVCPYVLEDEESA